MPAEVEREVAVAAADPEVRRLLQARLSSKTLSDFDRPFVLKGQRLICRGRGRIRGCIDKRWHRLARRGDQIPPLDRRFVFVAHRRSFGLPSRVSGSTGSDGYAGPLGEDGAGAGPGGGCVGVDGRSAAASVLPSNGSIGNGGYAVAPATHMKVLCRSSVLRPAFLSFLLNMQSPTRKDTDRRRRLDKNNCLNDQRDESAG